MDFDVGYACRLLKRLGSPHTRFHLVGCFSPPRQRASTVKMAAR